MMKKRMYLMIVAMLLLGTTACGTNADTTETATTQEQTEVATQEATVEEEATEEVTTEEATEEATTEAATEETAAEATTAETAQSDGAITAEEAEQLIVKALGTEDEATGNTYSFAHVNTMTVDGIEYHVFMWGWLVDGHVSKLTDLFVVTDGSAIYEGIFVGDGATVYTETNYLEQ